MNIDATFRSRRSNVLAQRGMVATSQPLAAQAGLDILKAGGNAADAAIVSRRHAQRRRTDFDRHRRRLFRALLRRRDAASHGVQRFRTGAGRSIDTGDH